MIVREFFVLIAGECLLAIVAAYLVERSITLAFKGLRVALKSEFTSDTGRVNLASMVLLVFIIAVFNLHKMLADALRVGHPSGSGDDVLAPTALVGLFLIGSVICVLIMEKKK